MKYRIPLGRNDFRAHPYHAEAIETASSIINGSPDSLFGVDATVWRFNDEAVAGQRIIRHPAALVRLMFYSTVPRSDPNIMTHEECHAQLDAIVQGVKEHPRQTSV